MGCGSSSIRDSDTLAVGAVCSAVAERDVGQMVEAVRLWDGQDCGETSSLLFPQEQGPGEMDEASFPMEQSLYSAFDVSVAETFSLLLSPYHERVARLFYAALCGPQVDQALLLTTLFATLPEDLPRVASQYSSLFGRDLLPLILESQEGPSVAERLVCGWILEERQHGQGEAAGALGLARELLAGYRARDTDAVLHAITRTSPPLLEAAIANFEAQNASTMLTFPALISELFSGLGLYGINLLLHFQVFGSSARTGEFDAAWKVERDHDQGVQGTGISSGTSAARSSPCKPASAFAYALHYVLEVSCGSSENLEIQLRALTVLGSTRCPGVSAAYEAEYRVSLTDAIRRVCFRLPTDFVDLVCTLWERGPIVPARR